MAAELRDRVRAKAIIVEIIRQSGGLFRNKTNLFKAFWLAHVEYARTHATGLSRWPIVRMPNGPGIDKIDILLGDLMTEEMVRVDQVQVGEKSAFEFELIGEPTATFSDEERHAIREAISLVAGKSAALVSHESHRQSRSWTEAKDGDRLDVFLDVIPDKEFAERSVRIGAIVDRVQAIAAQTRDGGQL